MSRFWHTDTGFKKLEAKGYLVRNRNQDDERSLRVTLTDSGKGLHEQALEIPYKVTEFLPLNRKNCQSSTN